MINKKIFLHKTWSLTTSADTPALTSNSDTITGITGDSTASNNSYTIGDNIVDASTTDADVLNLTVVGTTASSVATVTNVETINLLNAGAGSQTFNSLLVTGAKNITANVVVAGQAQTISNVPSLTTVVGLSGKGDLTATTAADVSGTSDTSNLKLSGVGTSSSVRSAVDIGNTNAIEAVKITASGANYVNLTAGTANKSITVIGDGSLDIKGAAAAALTGDSTSSALTYDASSATGKQTVLFGAGAITAKGGSLDDTFVFTTTLGTTDSVDGGAGANKVTFTLGNATQINPVLKNVQTVSATFNDLGTYNAAQTTGLTTLNLLNAGSVNEAVTNLPATVTALNFTDANTHGTVTVGYATGAAAVTTLTVGTQNSTTATATALTLGATALTNAGNVTITSVRDVDNTASVTNILGTVDVGTATSLTANTGALAGLTLGNLTGASVTTETVNATSAAFTQGTFVGAGLTNLTLTSTGGAALTTGNIGTSNSTTTASKLVNYSVTTGATTTVNLGTIDAATKSASGGVGASALKTVTYNLGSAATVTAIGAIDASDENGSGTNAGSGVAQLDAINFTLGADAVGSVTVGTITARSVTAANFTVAAQTNAHATGASLTIDESIGAATIVAGANETFTLTVAGIDDASTDLYNLAIGTIAGSGAGNVVIAGLTTVKSIADINLSAVTGTSEVAASTLSGTSGISILIGTGGTTATGVSGSNNADVIVGGAKADTISGGAGADDITGGLGADVITGGTGADTINLTETTSSVDTLKYAEDGASNVDQVTGFKAGTDIISLSKANSVFTSDLSTAVGTDISATVSAGSATAVTVAVDTSAAIADATNLLFFSNTASTSFATAIGSASITDTTTGWGNANNTTVTGVPAIYYDSANGQAVFGYVTDTTATGTALTSADTFTEIVRVGMLSSDFTAANALASLSIF